MYRVIGKFMCRNFPFYLFPVFGYDFGIHPIDMCCRFYTVTESSANLYAVRIYVKYGIFGIIRVCNHYQIGLIRQIQVECRKESASEEVIFLHGICVPIIISIIKGVFIFQFQTAFWRTVNGRILQYAELFHYGVNHYHGIDEKADCFLCVIA